MRGIQLGSPGRRYELVSFPAYISAATQLDQANTPPALLDFFGLKSRDAGVTRLGCPLLAFYGTRGDVGGQADLDVIESAPARLSIPRLAVETRLLEGADHMYTGEEAQVAAVISDWARRVLAGPRRTGVWPCGTTDGGDSDSLTQETMSIGSRTPPAAPFLSGSAGAESCALPSAAVAR